MENNGLNDDKSRNTSRFSFDKNIVVEAGAGTGKTTLLIDRLCYLLLGHKGNDEDFSIENIVALTFTEKAAAEISFRLAKKLNNIISAFETSVTPDINTKLVIENLKTRFNATSQNIIKNAKKTLSALERAQIQTIHGFCSYILKTFAVDAQINPSFDVDEGNNFVELFNKHFKEWLEKELSEHNTDNEKWKFILKKIQIQDIVLFAKNLCSGKLENYKPNKLNAFLPVFEEKIKLLTELKEQYFVSTKGKKPKEAIEQALAILKETKDNITKNTLDVEQPVKINYPTAAPANWDKDDWQQAVEIISFANDANIFSQKIVSACYELLIPFARSFKNVYDNDFVSFDGLLVKTRNLLASNKYVRSKLKAKYRYIMIDEFQDTDPLQGEIILFLGEKNNSFTPKWQDALLEQGKLFVVGDPKQSIYRFRGADIKAYDKFTDLILKQNGVKCLLQTNFRSQVSLTEPINAVMQNVMQKSSFQAAYEPIFAHRKSLGKNSFEINLSENESTFNSENARQMQADFISEQICSLQGKKLYPNGKELTLRDIAILFRSATNLDIYLESLRQNNINFIVEENKYFYATPEITDLVNLLKTIINPFNKISLTGILRSPLAGLTDLEIYKLQKINCLDYRKKLPPDFKFAQEFYKKLIRFHDISSRMALSEFINTVIKETYAFEVLTSSYGGERTAANIFKFISIISSLKELSDEILDGFLDVSQNFLSKNKEGESPLADDFLDAVNIMTVHKAKGLEFPVVILADISSETKPPYNRNDFLYEWYLESAGFTIGGFKNIEMAVMQEYEKKQGQAEEVRNFYVALTRAKDKLILLGNRKKTKKNTPASYLEKSFSLENDAKTSEITIDGCPHNIALNYFREKSKKKKNKSENAKITVNDIPLWNAERQKRLDSFEKNKDIRLFTSASSMKQESEGKRTVSSRIGTQKARLVGTLCHKVLELHNFKSRFSLENIKNICVLLGENISQKETDETAAEVFEILSSFAKSSEYEKISNSKIIAKEMPFAYVANKKPLTVMKGFVDLLIENNGNIEIIDYKSEQVEKGKESVHSLEFKTQCEIYKKAVSKLFPKKLIKTKVLFLRTAVKIEVK